jgi:hypothetical protein
MQCGLRRRKLGVLIINQYCTDLRRGRKPKKNFVAITIGEKKISPASKFVAITIGEISQPLNLERQERGGRLPRYVDA